MSTKSGANDIKEEISGDVGAEIAFMIYLKIEIGCRK
jgi:hypothetical protein